jgi:FKBP-type peptidyl-prolyl cis-trans isomerase FklB
MSPESRCLPQWKASVFSSKRQNSVPKTMIKNATFLVLFVASLLTCNAALAQASAPEALGTTAFASRKDALSYAIGVSTARNLTKDGVEINPEMVLKGMQDVVEKRRTVMTETEIRSVMNGLISEMRQNMANNRVEAEAANKQRGNDYREAFSKQIGVQSMPNGVLYKVVKAGTGPKPTDTDTVLVNYRGTLTSGTEFDATPEGKPATLNVSQLINGWKAAIKTMPVGSRWTLVIPPQLAYGVRGVGSDIGPSETLVFDVELMAIKR